MRAVCSSGVNGLGNLPWDAIASSLDERGYALVRGAVAADRCVGFRELFPQDALFRSTVIMERHRFGRGTYRYFADPVPAPIAAMRAQLYAGLAPVAVAWAPALRLDPAGFPPNLERFLARCHEQGQTRPTPLLLKYGAGDYNCLHQDLYGEVAFPLQATLFCSRRGIEYDGGAFVLVEQRPRAQSKPEVIDPDIGDLLIFPNRHRPSGRGRVAVRHGVSTVERGERYALGIIFHDAR